MKAIFVTLNCFKSEFRQDDSFSWLTEELKAQWEETSDIPDIVAIGLQEFLPFDKAFASGDNSYEELFQKQLHNVLEKTFPYSSKSTDTAHLFDCLNQENMQFTPVKRIRHVSNALFLFSKRDLCISNVSTAFMGSGWFYMGNKGVVAIKCSVESKDAKGISNNWTLCVISCHFDAHKTDPFYRNNQFREISSRILFEETVIPGSTSKYFFIEDQDVTILLGDLNYRVYDSSRSASELVSLCQSGKYTELFQFDQLSKQLSKASNSFMGSFTEAKITFPPTYKYLVGTETINTSRIPSWCDRILFRSPDFDYQILKYFSVPSCQLSDHKPVIAIVNLSPESTPNSRARAKSMVPNKNQTDSYRAFKQGVGTTVDATANVAVNLWTSPLRIPFVVLSLAILCLSLYSSK